MTRYIASRMRAEDPLFQFRPYWPKSGIKATEPPKPPNTVGIVICISFSLGVTAESWGTKIVAEEVWFRVLRGRMITFKDEFSVF